MREEVSVGVSQRMKFEGELVHVRVADRAKQVLRVEAMLGEVLGQRIEQTRQ